MAKNPINTKAERWMQNEVNTRKEFDDPKDPSKVGDIMENLEESSQGNGGPGDLDTKDWEYLHNKYDQHGDRPVSQFDMIKKSPLEKPVETSKTGVKTADEIDPTKTKGSMTGPETAEPTPDAEAGPGEPELDEHQQHAENTFNKVKGIMNKKPVTNEDVIQAIADKNLVNHKGMQHLHDKYLASEMPPEQQVQEQDEQNSEAGNPITSPENK